LDPIAMTVQQCCLRCSTFAEAMLDPIDRALDVSPTLAAQQRQLLGARRL
jgi:hypothetical protein